MKKIIWIDIKKLCKNRIIQIVFAGLLFVMICDPIYVRIHSLFTPSFQTQIGENPFQFWILINSAGWGSKVCYAAFWVLPVVLTGLVLYDEKTSTVCQTAVIRCRKRDYYISKVISVGIFSFVFSLLLYAVNAAVTYSVFPVGAPHTEQYAYNIPQRESFSYALYEINPILMVIAYVLLNAFAISVLAVFCVGVHMCFRFPNRYVAVVVPILVFYTVSFILGSLKDLNSYDISIVIQPLAAAMYKEPITTETLFISFGIWVGFDGVLFIAGFTANKDIL